MTLRRSISGFALLLIVTSSVHARQGGELIERTMAIVGGQALTLSDVRAAVALGLVAELDAAADFAAATPRLIDRMLMLREVQRYAPPEPEEGLVDRRLGAIRDRFATPDQYARALQAGGFSDARLRSWIRDDLRVEAYLTQRFSAVTLPTDGDPSDPGRDRAASERRAALIADWLDDLRRRTPVVELWKQQ